MRISVLAVGMALTAVLSAAVDDLSHPAFMRAMRESMAQMHTAMEHAQPTGDPDRDFALMMIPHHQGAIDMAKVELLYGQDPVMRRLAQEIITDQKSEIDAMQLRLARNLAKPKTEE